MLIESSPMTGATDALIGWIFTRLTRATVVGRPNYMWISPFPRKAEGAMHAWLDRAGLLSYEVGQGQPWIRKLQGELRLSTGPRLRFMSPDMLDKYHLDPVIDVVVDSAQDVGPLTRWVAEHVRGQIRFVGMRDGEYSGMLEGADDVVRLSFTDAVNGGWVDEKRAALIRDTTDETFFDRYYLLNKAEVDRTVGLPLLPFCRKRLFIRTDKPWASLKQSQRDNAAERDPDTGTALVPFEVTPMQKLYLAHKRIARRIAKSEGRPPRILLLKYRRGGFTTLEQAESYRMCVSNRRATVVTIAHTKDSTEKIFSMVHDLHRYDPRAPNLVGGKPARGHMEFEGTRSRFFIGQSGSMGFSRGDALQRAHCSEVSSWCKGPKNHDKVDDLMAGILGAASAGEVVLETTPRGIEWFATKYREAKRGENNYYPVFLPWFVDRMNVKPPGTYNPEEIMETISADEEGLIERVGRDYKRVMHEGHIAWRRSMQKDFGRLFRQEFPEDDESCFLTSGENFFDPEKAMQMIELLTHQLTHQEKVPGGLIEWVEEPKAGVTYRCGVDTSEGLSHGDPNGFGILRKDTGKQVCWGHGRWRPRQLAEVSLKWCQKYNDCLIGIERNNHGHAVLEAWKAIAPRIYLKSQWIGGRLYHYVPLEHPEPIKARKAARPGWLTTEPSRDRILDQCFQWSMGEESESAITDVNFLRETLTFNKQPSGKFEADGGSHDDRVLKWAIANIMRKVKVTKAKIL